MLGSADTATFDDLSGTALKDVNVQLGGFDGTPDGSADTVIVNGTDRRDTVNVSTSGSAVAVDGLHTAFSVTGSEPADALQINALGGDDDVTVDSRRGHADHPAGRPRRGRLRQAASSGRRVRLVRTKTRAPARRTR